MCAAQGGAEDLILRWVWGSSSGKACLTIQLCRLRAGCSLSKNLLIPLLPLYPFNASQCLGREAGVGADRKSLTGKAKIKAEKKNLKLERSEMRCGSVAWIRNLGGCLHFPELSSDVVAMPKPRYCTPCQCCKCISIS